MERALYWALGPTSLYWRGQDTSSLDRIGGSPRQIQYEMELLTEEGEGIEIVVCQ